MRKPIIIGNWKMNNGPQEAHEFLHIFEHLANGKKIENVDFAIAAPFISLPYLLPHSHGDDEAFEIPLAAQNVHFEEKGAFTGEISLSMLEQLGVMYAIIGHSERREMFNETDETVNKKIKATLNSTIIPVFAFGETEKEFEDKKTEDVIKNQITKGLNGIEGKEVERIVFAYEPIWAIGTGKTATPEQAQNAIKYTRSVIESLYGKEVSQKVRIQYGGSVNPENIKSLMEQEDIDGALVGGASVTAESFFKLVTFK